MLGGPLGCCCASPYKTGYFRDGFCRTDESDHGRHVVCAQVGVGWGWEGTARKEAGKAGNGLVTRV